MWLLNQQRFTLGFRQMQSDVEPLSFLRRRDRVPVPESLTDSKMIWRQECVCILELSTII